MRINHLFYRSLTAALLLLVSGLLFSAAAQSSAVVTAKVASDPPAPSPRPQAVLTDLSRVAGKSDLYCGGFIQYAPAPNYLQIVGGEEEQEQRVYSEGDYVYINAGAQEGVQLGQEYTVVRPRGQFKSKFSAKKGWLGVYTQEVGALRVVVVKERVSVALVFAACDTLLLGDLLRGYPQRVAPPIKDSTSNLDRFTDSNGKPVGRIVLARDGLEMLTSDDIVFIDLGSEDNVKAGDYLTIYRAVGRGNISRFRDDEVTVNARDGFESTIFRGGKYSNQSQRVRNPNNNGVYGPNVSSPEIQSKRPPMPRKVVGEMVILSTQQRTATAVITRIAQEVVTGDYVEIQ